MKYVCTGLNNQHLYLIKYFVTCTAQSDEMRSQIPKKPSFECTVILFSEESELLKSSKQTDKLGPTLLCFLAIHLSQLLSISSHLASLCRSTSGGMSSLHPGDKERLEHISDNMHASTATGTNARICIYEVEKSTFTNNSKINKCTKP